METLRIPVPRYPPRAVLAVALVGGAAVVAWGLSAAVFRGGGEVMWILPFMMLFAVGGRRPVVEADELGAMMRHARRGGAIYWKAVTKGVLRFEKGRAWLHAETPNGAIVWPLSASHAALLADRLPTWCPSILVERPGTL